MSATKELLRRLAAQDERCLPDVAWAESPATGPPGTRLDRRTRTLVELAALVASDAATPSLRWAVDRASSIGIRDETLVRVLLATAPAAGAAQVVVSAPRLALALDLDL